MLSRARLAIIAVTLIGCAGPLRTGGTTAERVDSDVAAGYVATKEALSDWGDWKRDDLHHVHWCPRFDATQTEGEEPWREIVDGRGFWVLDEVHDGGNCWVPGVASGGARVVVRTKMPPRTVDVSRQSLGVQSVIASAFELGMATASAAADVARTAVEIRDLVR